MEAKEGRSAGSCAQQAVSSACSPRGMPTGMGGRYPLNTLKNICTRPRARRVWVTWLGLEGTDSRVLTCHWECKLVCMQSHERSPGGTCVHCKHE